MSQCTYTSIVGSNNAENNKMNTVALEIVNLTKSFRKDGRGSQDRKGIMRLLARRKTITRVVDSVSFAVNQGEIFGVLGPNGSGKSTLIRIISTLLLPDEGIARVFGHDVTKEPDIVRNMISRVSADAAFFRSMSAIENLTYSARLYGIPAKEVRSRMTALLRRLDMPMDKLTIQMSELSRGMQQKIAITRAFMTYPALLLLDEPTTGLDPKSKRKVQSFVREIRNEHGGTVLLTTHDMEEAETLCDRIAILNSGKIVAMGTANEIKAGCNTCGDSPSLETVFIKLAGKSIDEAEEED